MEKQQFQTLLKTRDFLTPRQAAQYLGVSMPNMYKLLNSGLIPYKLLGDVKKIIFVDDLLEFLKDR